MLQSYFLYLSCKSNSNKQIDEKFQTLSDSTSNGERKGFKWIPLLNHWTGWNGKAIQSVKLFLNADQGRACAFYFLVFWVVFFFFGENTASNGMPEFNGLALAMCCPPTGDHLRRWDPHHHWLHAGRLHHAGLRWFLLRRREPQHCWPSRVTC